MKQNNYDDLEDDQKAELFPDEFLDELREEFGSDPDSAISRAEEQGISINEII